MREYRIDDMESLIREFNSMENCYIYRGHQNATWKLESTLERMIWGPGSAERFEQFSLLRFKSKFHLYDKENESPQSKLAWLSIMQHYGVPTRLLDFTESPYVALYFAIEDFCPRARTDFAIFALNYTQLMDCSLAHIRDKDPSFIHTRGMIADRQDHVFEDTVDRSSYDIAWVTEPGVLNARLDRQSGCFVLSGHKEKKISNILSGPIYRDCDFRKYTMAGALYEHVFALLRKMNLSSKNIYGDLQGLARSIKMEMQVYAT